MGLLISAAIAVLLWGTVRDIGRRLMDGVDPALTDQLTALVENVAPEGTSSRLRWSGHRLHVEISVPLTGAEELGQLAKLTDSLEQAVHQAMRNVGSVTVVPRFA